MFERQRLGCVIHEIDKVICNTNASDTGSDDANVCITRQRVLATLPCERICIGRRIDPK